MTTHISYETAKRLKEFLGDSMPDPLDDYWWCLKNGYRVPLFKARAGYPSLQLHDLLSKPFCEAMERKGVGIDIGPMPGMRYRDTAYGVAIRIMDSHYKGGLPAVESALLEMMEAK